MITEQAIGQAEKTTSLTQQHPLGMQLRTTDGRTFRYGRAASGNIPAGTLVAGQVARPETSFILGLMKPVRAGDVELEFILNAVTGSVLPNEFAGGLLWINVGTAGGDGHHFVIDRHTGGTSGQTITMRLDEPLTVDVSHIGSTFLQARNPYGAMVFYASTPTTAPLGVTVTAVPGLSYAWVQTGGLGLICVTGAAAAGALVYPTANQGKVSVVGSALAGMPPVGQLVAAANVTFSPVFLQIE